METTKGRLVVALPELRDPNFERTVVLMLQHDEDAALGVVLNRPSGLDLVGNLSAWEGVLAPPVELFTGGPVGRNVAIGLARSDSTGTGPGWAPLFPGLGTVELGRPPADLTVPVEAVRIFLGYAGWGSRQLEAEIEAGAWLVVDSEPDDAVSTEPLGLWSVVLGRQPGSVSWLARYPEDPNLN